MVSSPPKSTSAYANRSQSTGPSDELKRLLANEIWLKEGKPEGQDKRHWELAEQILTTKTVSGHGRKNPSDMQSDAFDFLIETRFPSYGLCILLSPIGLKKQLDALLMVADCQNRVARLATLYTNIKDAYKPEEFAELRALATEYLEGTRGDRRVTKMKTIPHVVGEHPPQVALISYFSDIKKMIGEANFQFIGDCFANNDNATFFYCELGSLTGWLPKTGYRVEMPWVEGSTKLVDRIYEGRIRLARSSIDGMSKIVEQWTTDEWKNTPAYQRVSKQWPEFWDQVATIWHASETYVENADGSRTPVRDFRCGMIITMGDMIQTKTPLITEHRIIPMKVSGDVRTYDFAPFSVLRWEHNSGLDRFMPVSDVSPDECDRPCPAIDMPNYHNSGQADIGFGCSTPEEYQAKLQSGEITIEGALMPLIFDHPAVSGLAKHADRDYSKLYKMVSPATTPVGYTRTSIEGFTLSPAKGLSRPSFYQLYEASQKIAAEYGLVNNQEFFKTDENKPRTRRTDPCDTGLRHVYVTTLNEATARLQGVHDKLAEDDKVVIGEHVVREEDRAISFTNPDFAEHYLMVKNGNDKTAIVAAKQRYCDEYPHNSVFHPQLPPAPTVGKKWKKEKKEKKEKK